MYSFLKNIMLNSFYPLLIVLTSVYTLNSQIASATDSSVTDAISGQGSVEISIKDGKHHHSTCEIYMLVQSKQNEKFSHLHYIFPPAQCNIPS